MVTLVLLPRREAKDVPAQYIDGAKLRALRIDRGLTQEELAHQAGLSVASMPVLEGNKRPARELTVKALADALGVKREEILRPPQVEVKMQGHAIDPEKKERIRRLVDAAKEQELSTEEATDKIVRELVEV